MIHAHSYHALPSYYAAKNRGDTPLVFTPHYHGKGHTWFRSLLHIPYKLVGNAIFNEAKVIVAVSEWEQRLILENFKLDGKDLEVIPNGINNKEFTALKRVNKGRNILSVGRLEQYKGMQYLIKVLPKLNDDVKLTIVGRGVYKNQLEKMIEEHNLGERIEMINYLDRPSLLQRYADADVFALLSEDEAYGITVAEALAAGTPCVVAEASALSEWVDGISCLGVKLPIDIATLRDRIGSLIGKRIKRDGIRDWDEVTARLLDLYRKNVSV